MFTKTKLLLGRKDAKVDNVNMLNYIRCRGTINLITFSIKRSFFKPKSGDDKKTFQDQAK